MLEYEKFERVKTQKVRSLFDSRERAQLCKQNRNFACNPYATDLPCNITFM